MEEPNFNENIIGETKPNEIRIDSKTDELEKPKKVIKLMILVIVLCFGSVFLFGAGYWTGVKGDMGVVKYRITGKDAPTKYKDIDFSRFWDALDKIFEIWFP